MKTKILFLALIIPSLFWLISCDKISEPYIKNIAIGWDTTGIDTVTFSPTLQTTRAVLLEEFTGHKCPNCPAASVIAHDLKLANPGKVVLVSIHAGVFATKDGSGDFTYDFSTNDGNALDGFFKVGDYGYPNGLISRRKFDANKYVWSPQDWTNEVNSIKVESSIASIALNAYSVNGTNVKVYVKTEFIGANNTQYNLGIILTEDSIIKPQKNNNTAVGTVPIILDYNHKSVFRSSFNGTWGSSVNSGPVGNNQDFLTGYTIPLGADWVATHCNVVAYLYDKITLEVFQVAETKVK